MSASPADERLRHATRRQRSRAAANETAGRIEALIPKQDRSHTTRQRLLDAAVEELLEHGYGRLTTQAIAQRAGVSRGAAQNHFPRKGVLVAEAVRHLGQQQTAELRRILAATPRGAPRVATALNVIYDQYSSGRFAAIIELSLAARQDEELLGVVTAEERAISGELLAIATDIFGAGAAMTLSVRWATAVSTVRGIALLKMLHHPPEIVDRQWHAARPEVVASLTRV